MNTAVTHADARVRISLTINRDFPELRKNGVPVMLVQDLHLTYRSEEGGPWSTSWTACGVDPATHLLVLDIRARDIPADEVPDWLKDLITDHTPSRGGPGLP